MGSVEFRYHDALVLPLVHFFLIAWVRAQTQASDPNKPLPTFQDYKVAHIYKGKLAIPVLRTPDDREYRTRIRRGAAEGANFAGHYAVVILGCGTQCSSFLIVDIQSGRVFARAQKEYTCQPFYKLDLAGDNGRDLLPIGLLGLQHWWTRVGTDRP